MAKAMVGRGHHDEPCLWSSLAIMAPYSSVLGSRRGTMAKVMIGRGCGHRYPSWPPTAPSWVLGWNFPKEPHDIHVSGLR